MNTKQIQEQEQQALQQIIPTLTTPPDTYWYKLHQVPNEYVLLHKNTKISNQITLYLGLTQNQIMINHTNDKENRIYIPLADPELLTKVQQDINQGLQ